MRYSWWFVEPFFPLSQALFTIFHLEIDFKELHAHRWLTDDIFILAWVQLDEEDFKEEQNLVARLVHMLVNDDNEQMFQVGAKDIPFSYIELIVHFHFICKLIIFNEALCQWLILRYPCRFWQLQESNLVKVAQSDSHLLCPLSSLLPSRCVKLWRQWQLSF